MRKTMFRYRSVIIRSVFITICSNLFFQADRATSQTLPTVFLNGQIQGTVVDQNGKPVSNAWVMADNGKTAKTEADGTFGLNGFPDGAYSIKVVAPLKKETVIPKIVLHGGKTPSVRIDMTDASGSQAVVTGTIKDNGTGKEVPACLEILNGENPVRWFDINGLPYGGRTDILSGTWHQKNRRYWTSGKFAFSTLPGELRIRAWADGYEPAIIRKDLKRGAEVHLDLSLHRLFDPSSEGWYKGDFHAHGVHGEKLYTVNIPFMAFILRSEGYRWFYLSWDFSNDGVTIDPFRVAESETGPDLFLALNSEYPKTFGGHVGSVGIGPPRKPLPYPCYSNTEIIKRDIIDQGGAAVPVHPLTGHMKSRELPFLMMGAPELICGFDFYTRWSEPLEKTWTMFINKGYRLCRTATSDTAFDLGRTPGTMGATFIHPEKGTLNRGNIVDAFKTGRTVISWESSLLTFTIDGNVCGKVFPADGQLRKGVIGFYHTPGEKIRMRVTRNGEIFREFCETVSSSGKTAFNISLNEKEKAWYTALCFREGPSSVMLAATSPFYFGNWPCPAHVPAEIEVHVSDADSKQPLNATLTLLDPESPDRNFETKNGVLHLQARTYQRIKVSAPGYTDLEKGILDNPAVNSFITTVTDEDLQTWSTYEKAQEILQALTLEFPLKRH